MTSPGVNGCWCGCNKTPTVSEFWGGEGCAQAWVRRVNRLVPLPPEKQAPSPLHHDGYPAQAAAVVNQYTRPVEETSPAIAAAVDLPCDPEPDCAHRPLPEAAEGDPTERVGEPVYFDASRWVPAMAGAEFPLVASTDTQVEQGQPGWLDRLITRLFGKGAA